MLPGVVSKRRKYDETTKRLSNLRLQQSRWYPSVDLVEAELILLIPVVNAFHNAFRLQMIERKYRIKSCDSVKGWRNMKTSLELWPPWQKCHLGQSGLQPSSIKPVPKK